MSTENQTEETTQEQQTEGLGDTIAKITNTLGLDKLAEQVANAMGKEDCGCNKRKQRLNDMFPYSK